MSVETDWSSHISDKKVNALILSYQQKLINRDPSSKYSNKSSKSVHWRWSDFKYASHNTKSPEIGSCACATIGK